MNNNEQIAQRINAQYLIDAVAVDESIPRRQVASCATCEGIPTPSAVFVEETQWEGEWEYSEPVGYCAGCADIQYPDKPHNLTTRLQ